MPCLGVFRGEGPDVRQRNHPDDLNRLESSHDFRWDLLKLVSPAYGLIIQPFATSRTRLMACLVSRCDAAIARKIVEHRPGHSI